MFLFQCRNRPSVAYALKCLKKQHIVETQQQEHVFSEKNILMSCKHSFITRCYTRFLRAEIERPKRSIKRCFERLTGRKVKTFTDRELLPPCIVFQLIFITIGILVIKLNRCIFFSFSGLEFYLPFVCRTIITASDL